MTTPLPSTTPGPTFPTPLPYDPNVLLTSIVFLEMTQYDNPNDSRSAQNRLFNILSEYVQSEKIDPQDITPEFEYVGILTLKN